MPLTRTLYTAGRAASQPDNRWRILGSEAAAKNEAMDYVGWSLLTQKRERSNRYAGGGPREPDGADAGRMDAPYSTARTAEKPGPPKPELGDASSMSVLTIGPLARRLIRPRPSRCSCDNVTLDVQCLGVQCSCVESCWQCGFRVPSTYSAGTQRPGLRLVVRQSVKSNCFGSRYNLTCVACCPFAPKFFTRATCWLASKCAPVVARPVLPAPWVSPWAS